MIIFTLCHIAISLIIWYLIIRQSKRPTAQRPNGQRRSEEEQAQLKPYRDAEHAPLEAPQNGSNARAAQPRAAQLSRLYLENIAAAHKLEIVRLAELIKWNKTVDGAKANQAASEMWLFPFSTFQSRAIRPKAESAVMQPWTVTSPWKCRVNNNFEKGKKENV